MKKIMFNDRYLMQAVLDGRKTQTRRIITPQPYYDQDVGMVWRGFASGRGIGESGEPQASYQNFVHHSQYKKCEVLAIAQNYRDAGIDPKHKVYNTRTRGYDNTCDTAGWTNKMFVRSELMPRKVRITSVRVQRLQDISDRECILEGVRITGEDDMNPLAYIYTFDGANQGFYSPKAAYAALIDIISGKGTWDSNPYVFVYDFELVK